MRETNLRTIDLNLLIALKALLEERHVTRAAERIHLSQPAMSRSLHKLRTIFNDPLLVRSANGLCLTSRAHGLQSQLQGILNDIKDMLEPPSQNPAQMKGEITIATRDYEIATVLPKVIQQVTQHAPDLKISIMTLTNENFDLLEMQEVDFIITASESDSATLHRKMLFEDDFVCLLSADNPIEPHELTLKKFIELKHGMISISGFGPGIVDLELAKNNLQREVMLRTSHFLCIPYLIVNTNLIITLPRKLGELLRQQANIKLLEAPLPIAAFPVYLYWHIKNHNNPVHQWLRNTAFV
jgi:DNA-binding transcriptional LysR family regulator